MIKLPYKLFSLNKIVLLAIFLCIGIKLHADTILPLRCGWYIAGSGNIVWHNDIEFKPKEGGFTKFRYDVGPGMTAAIGVLLREWRIEIEGAYRKNDLRRLSIKTPTGIKASGRTSGNVRDFAMMLNGYWDILIPNSWWVVYVGGGVGVSCHRREAVDFTGFFAHRDQTLLAWQVMAGVSYEIVEHTFLTAGWRLFSTPKVRSPRERSDEIILVNNIEIGVRIELF